MERNSHSKHQAASDRPLRKRSLSRLAKGRQPLAPPPLLRWIGPTWRAKGRKSSRSRRASPRAAARRQPRCAVRPLMGLEPRRSDLMTCSDKRANTRIGSNQAVLRTSFSPERSFPFGWRRLQCRRRRDTRLGDRSGLIRSVAQMFFRWMRTVPEDAPSRFLVACPRSADPPPPLPQRLHTLTEAAKGARSCRPPRPGPLRPPPVRPAVCCDDGTNGPRART